MLICEVACQKLQLQQQGEQQQYQQGEDQKERGRRESNEGHMDQQVSAATAVAQGADSFFDGQSKQYNLVPAAVDARECSIIRRPLAFS